MDSGERDHAEALYYHIASDAIASAEREPEEFSLAQYVSTSMMFSAFTLEAYINQEYKSHAEVAKLDSGKLNVRLKWGMLPLLLGSKKTFDRGATPFQIFDELIRRRDALVHFKPYTGGSDQPERFSVMVKDVGRAKTYFSCIPAMIRELHKLTSGQTVIPEFLNGAKYLSTRTISVSVSIPVEFFSEDNP
jgi:hypothetical protein